MRIDFPNFWQQICQNYDVSDLLTGFIEHASQQQL